MLDAPSAPEFDPVVRQPQIPFGLPQAASDGAPSQAETAVGFAEAAYRQHALGARSGRFQGDAEWIAADDVERPPPPSLEPADIAAELRLPLADAAALLQARRDFAFRNHPDRVEPGLRRHAAHRMQTANALIDDALRRIARKPG